MRASNVCSSLSYRRAPTLPCPSGRRRGTLGRGDVAVQHRLWPGSAQLVDKSVDRRVSTCGEGRGYRGYTFRSPPRHLPVHRPRGVDDAKSTGSARVVPSACRGPGTPSGCGSLWMTNGTAHHWHITTVGRPRPADLTRVRAARWTGNTARGAWTNPGAPRRAVCPRQAAGTTSTVRGVLTSGWIRT